MTPSQPFDLSTHLTQDILNMGGEELIAAPGAPHSYNTFQSNYWLISSSTSICWTPGAREGTCEAVALQI